MCVCVCTVTDFSAEDKLAASNFARRFIGVQGKDFVNLAPKIGRRIGQRAGHAHRCNISRKVESTCVDIVQSPLTYLFFLFLSSLTTPFSSKPSLVLASY